MNAALVSIGDLFPKQVKQMTFDLQCTYTSEQFCSVTVKIKCFSIKHSAPFTITTSVTLPLIEMFQFAAFPEVSKSRAAK